MRLRIPTIMNHRWEQGYITIPAHDITGSTTTIIAGIMHQEVIITGHLEVTTIGIDEQRRVTHAELSEDSFPFMTWLSD